MNTLIHTSSKVSGALAVVKSQWALLLVLLAVFLQPFGRTVEIPVLVMSVLGLCDLVKNRNNIRLSVAFKVFSAIYLCIWLPTLISLPDAINIEKSASTSFGMLRFYLSGIFILARIKSQEQIRLLIAGLAFIALFWASDNVFQALYGVDYFGRSALHGRIPGIFGDSPRSGWMLIPLAFVGILYFWDKFRKSVSLAAIATIILAIVISGDRGAMVALVWASVALIACGFYWGYRVSFRTVALGTVSLLVVLLVASQIPQVSQRVANTAVVLEGGYEAWDKASSRRLTLWSTALGMVEDNYLNGIGVRGFRYAYPEYAPDGDLFVSGDTGAYHAHQIVVEVLADTGVVGLIGYIATLVIFVWLMRESIKRKTYISFGFSASVVGVLMPINTHLSLYSSYWAQACWLLFALTVLTVFYEHSGEKAEV